MAKKERFQYYRESQYLIDNQTGYIYPCNNRRIVDLLNQLNNQADKNAEKYYKLKKKIEEIKK